MEQLIQRINELARKSKTSGLTEDELEERNELRRRYIESFKASMRDQLRHVKYVGNDSNGNA